VTPFVTYYLSYRLFVQTVELRKLRNHDDEALAYRTLLSKTEPICKLQTNDKQTETE
jgi:hypothetical protein